MTDNELERSDKLQNEYWTLMANVMGLHQIITKIYAQLDSAQEGLDHNKTKCSLAEAKKVAAFFDKQFPDGIEYVIGCHEMEIEELNDDIAAEKFDPITALKTEIFRC
jgi:hypothetical protein